MRKLFITCATRAAARNAMPWAAKIIKVEGGYMGFESVDDYQIWQNQR